MSKSLDASGHIPFRDAVRFWLKLGFISFGGPAGQIAIMHHELVEKRRWISERRFLHALNYCMVLPGPEAQQLATYIGWLMHRSLGGIVAGALFVLPSLVLLILLSWMYVAWGDLTVMAGIFYGIKPAVTAIVLQAAHRIGTRSLKNRWLWALALAAFAGISILHLPFPAILAAAALIGYAGSKLAPSRFQTGHGHPSLSAPHPRAFIDDDTPPPAHARLSPRRLAAVLLAGGLCWLIPMLFLAGYFGWAHTLTQMGRFFTQAALLTFGGAYAVLPYVFQNAVDHFHWATAGQMMDGLALGETTPGPLIMIVTFVGFLGGYTHALFGPDMSFLAGAAGAITATWFTFLPSFLFILAGGPLVEHSRAEGRLDGPLTAITAAVVGVILNLALSFAGHVFLPQGAGSQPDPVAILIFTGAALALFRFRRSVIEVIAASALIGLGVRLLSV